MKSLSVRMMLDKIYYLTLPGVEQDFFTQLIKNLAHYNWNSILHLPSSWINAANLSSPL